MHACEVGTSHVRAGRGCEDSCWASIEQLSGGQSLLAIFVADGAGSAAHGGEGSEAAIRSAAKYIAEQVQEIGFVPSADVATALVERVRADIEVLANSRALTSRDFACTFLGLLSNDNGTLAFQVGDGGIVLDTGEGLELALQPMSGEYANMTHFVTEAAALELLETRNYPGRAQKAAVFTDGLQNLALDMVAEAPHAPFFARFFDELAKANPAQEDQLQHALLRFLGSQMVNERTDDDKTLALALWKE